MRPTRSIESFLSLPVPREEPAPNPGNWDEGWASDLFHRDRDRGWRYGYHLLAWELREPQLRDPDSEASKQLAQAMHEQNWLYGVRLECAEDDSNELRLGLSLRGSFTDMVRAVAYMANVDAQQLFAAGRPSDTPSVYGIHTTERRYSELMFGDHIYASDLSVERLMPRSGLASIEDLPERLDDPHRVYGADVLRAVFKKSTGDSAVDERLGAALGTNTVSDGHSLNWRPLVDHLCARRSSNDSMLMDALLLLFEHDASSPTPADVVLVDGGHVESLKACEELSEYKQSGGWMIEEYREDDERREDFKWGFEPRMLETRDAAAVTSDLRKLLALYARSRTVNAQAPSLESVI